METFTIYQLTLTGAGFREITIPHCSQSSFGIELPGGSFVEGHTLDRAINKHLNRTYHYISRNPDFEIGKRAIMEEVKRSVKSMRELADSTEELLKYDL